MGPGYRKQKVFFKDLGFSVYGIYHVKVTDLLGLGLMGINGK